MLEIIIYKATNLINNKVYIGQTIKTLKQRKERHYRDAQRLNYYFYKALRKYEKEDFYWDILEECNSIEELNKKEMYYIKLYDSTNRDKGYNSRTGGDNSLFNKETKKRVSKGLIGKKQSKESQIKKVLSQIKSNHCQKVLCINNNIIYNSISEASKELNLDRTNISRVCKGERKHTQGYKFIFTQ